MNAFISSKCGIIFLQYFSERELYYAKFNFYLKLVQWHLV